MPKKFDNRLQAFHEFEQLLLAYPQGLSKSEIAQKLGIHRATAGDYVDEFSRWLAIAEPAPDRYAIDREHYKLKLELTLNECLTLHSGVRMLEKCTDKHNPHAASAVRQLANVMEKFAPLIAQHMRWSADAIDGEKRRRDPVFLDVLATLSEAWSLGRKVKLTHQLEDGKVFEYEFAPYYVEPYPVGRTMHVIGLRKPPNQIRTFKIERIRTVKLLNESFEIPNDFDPREHLMNAWGIWASEHQPETVVLRFARRVAMRVRESVWHPNEVVTETADGSILWQAEIAQWREMLNWVRGWGADCEVLKPVEMRETLMGEARAIAEQYGWQVHSADTSGHTKPSLSDTFSNFFREAKS